MDPNGDGMREKWMESFGKQSVKSLEGAKEGRQQESEGGEQLVTPLWVEHDGVHTDRNQKSFIFNEGTINRDVKSCNFQ